MPAAPDGALWYSVRRRGRENGGWRRWGKPYERQAKLMGHSMLAAAEGAGKLEAGAQHRSNRRTFRGLEGCSGIVPHPTLQSSPAVASLLCLQYTALGVREDSSALRLCPLVCLFSLTQLWASN